MERWLFLFLICAIVYGSAIFIWWYFQKEKARQRVVRNLASTVNPEGSVRTTILIEKSERLSRFAGFLKAGRSPEGAGRIDRFSKGRFLLLTLLGVFAGFFVGTKLIGTIGILAPAICAFAAGALPRIYRSKNRDKRLAAMEDQFPDALDFLARSVRAGNAFSIALELLAAEAGEPLKSEIARVTREMALGASLENAFSGLTARIPLLEVRMFVAAVLLQRETGGNLAEVLLKLATSVRERLRLRGQVQAASGQGRMTAKVLSFLPVGTILMLELTSPSYIGTLTSDPVGRNLLGVAIVSQILGYLVMQKMIKVEV